jgi:hypothetical protein
VRESAWNTLRPTLVDKIIADALAKASLSDWDDEPSVAKFADEILTAKDTIAQRFIDYGDRTRAELIDSGYEPAEVRAAEEAAHEAERRGNRKPLADLLHEHWDRVGQNTRDLVEKIVRGEKKYPGPRPMTREE